MRSPPPTRPAFCTRTSNRRTSSSARPTLAGRAARLPHRLRHRPGDFARIAVGCGRHRGRHDRDSALELLLEHRRRHSALHGARGDRGPARYRALRRLRSRRRPLPDGDRRLQPRVRAGMGARESRTTCCARTSRPRSTATPRVVSRSARELAARLRDLERRRAERHAHERGRVAAETSGQTASRPDGRRRRDRSPRRRRVLLPAPAARAARRARARRAGALGARGGVARDRAADTRGRLRRRVRAGGESGGSDPDRSRAGRALARDRGDRDPRDRAARSEDLGEPYAGDPAADWKILGESPIPEVRLPRAVYRWRIEKEGYESVDLSRRPPDDAAPNARLLVRVRHRAGSIGHGPRRHGAGARRHGSRAVRTNSTRARRARTVLHRPLRGHQPRVPGVRRRRWVHQRRALARRRRAGRCELGSSTTPGDLARPRGSSGPIPTARTISRSGCELVRGGGLLPLPRQELSRPSTTGPAPPSLPSSISSRSRPRSSRRRTTPAMRRLRSGSTGA